MRRGILIVVAATLLVGSACGGGGGTKAAETRTVQVDNKTDKYNGAFLAYFPNAVTVRQGDTVDFHSNWRGEAHTVTMGTTIEPILTAALKNPNGPPPPGADKLPDFFPQGPGDIHQNGAQPCYLATGAPPTDPNTPCPKTAQPAFNGKQSYFNSGWLSPDDTFKLKLASDATPGTYHYYCLVHGPEMSGTITVVGKDAKVPSAATVDAAGKKQLDDVVNKLAPADEAAKKGQFPLPGLKNVAGYGALGVQNAFITEFIPATINAKVGEKVTWTVLGGHTISFKAPVDPGGYLKKNPDGSVRFVPDPSIVGPVGFPPPPQEQGGGGPPSSGAPQIKTIDGGSYDGSAFKSTGFVMSDPSSQLIAYTLSFTKVGDYSYVCLVHPGMGGVVHVT